MTLKEICFILVLSMSSMYFYSNSFSIEKSYGKFEDVVYISNYDGDTITVDIPYVPNILGDAITVRVYGVDTPEIKGSCEKEIILAKEAKKYVSTILRTSYKINLTNVKRDKYFRILADVETTQGSLAKLLLDKGYAVEYDDGTKMKNWCE